MPLNIKDVVYIRPAADGFRPPPDSSLLPEGYRYVPITFRMKGPTEQDLIPYMVAATYIILSVLFLQFRQKSWLYWISDVSAWTSCFALHHFQQPLLSLYLALGYTVWNLHSGSFASKNLPGHRQFMRDLKPVKASESSTQCMICWGEDCELAKLPCGHHFCKPCLRQMGEGERIQTTCPMCQLPLFGVHDRLMLITEKGNYVCMAIMFTKLVMEIAFELMRRRYRWALFNCGLLGFMLAFPIYAVFKLRGAGVDLREWWGGKPEKVRSKSFMRVSGAVFLCGVATTGVNVWNDYHRFKRV